MKFSLRGCPCQSNKCGVEKSCPLNDEANECRYLEEWVLNA